MNMSKSLIFSIILFNQILIFQVFNAERKIKLCIRLQLGYGKLLENLIFTDIIT